MYELTVKLHFDAAHFVRGYPGNCANTHGHRWFVVLKIECEELNDLGIAIDFRTVKELAKPLIDSLDHTLLNDHGPFRNINPTTENLSKYVFLALADRIAELGAQLTSVEVWESEQCGVRYAA